MRRQRSRPSPVTLTGRGGIAVIFALGLLGAVLGTQLSLGPVPGLLFVAGCTVAPLMTRRSDQLTLVVSPPAVFFVITALVKLVGAIGDKSVLQSALGGLLLGLASGAPWLFLGTALAVGIAATRGLPGNLQDLSARLAAGQAADPRKAESDAAATDRAGVRPGSRMSRRRGGGRLGGGRLAGGLLGGGRRAPGDDYDEDPVRWDVQSPP